MNSGGDSLVASLTPLPKDQNNPVPKNWRFYVCELFKKGKSPPLPLRDKCLNSTLFINDMNYHHGNSCE